MNLVEQIYNSVISITETELGSEWQRLRKVFEPAQNDFRNIYQGFGLRHGSAATDSDATRVSVLRHNFDLILAHRAAERDTDLDIQGRLNSLYSSADEIFKELLRSNLNLNFVTLVSNCSLATPEVLENGCVLLTMSFDVNYYVDPY